MSYEPNMRDIILIEEAAEHMKAEAELLRECHTSSTLGDWPEEEAEVEAVYENEMTIATRLRELAGRMRAGIGRDPLGEALNSGDGSYRP